MPKPAPAVIEDVELWFRNFEGREDRMNTAGARNFNVRLPEDIAKEMAEAGWNVKEKAPHEDDEDGTPKYLLKVNVSYRLRAPKIILVTYPDGADGERRLTKLGESEITLLDWADILTADLIITSSEYEVRGESGITAYLQSLYVTIQEDPLEKKYGDLRLLGESASENSADPPELS